MNGNEDIVSVLEHAKRLVQRRGLARFEAADKYDGAQGFCVGKAIIRASEDLELQRAWMGARWLFLTLNGVRPDEYNLRYESAVVWNDKAVAAGIDVARCFDRAIAAAKGLPLPEAPSIDVQWRCVGGCGVAVDDEGDHCFRDACWSRYLARLEAGGVAA